MPKAIKWRRPLNLGDTILKCELSHKGFGGKGKPAGNFTDVVLGSFNDVIVEAYMWGRGNVYPGNFTTVTTTCCYGCGLLAQSIVLSVLLSG